MVSFVMVYQLLSYNVLLGLPFMKNSSIDMSIYYLKLKFLSNDRVRVISKNQKMIKSYYVTLTTRSNYILTIDLREED